jgi:hypothetical protein
MPETESCDSCLQPAPGSGPSGSIDMVRRCRSAGMGASRPKPHQERMVVDSLGQTQFILEHGVSSVSSWFLSQKPLLTEFLAALVFGVFLW